MTKATIEWDDIETNTYQQADHAFLLSSAKRLQPKMAFSLVPSFLQRRARPGHHKSARLHPTSYLDGLRGVSSFIVFMGHYTEENLGWYTEPYGLYEDGAPSSPLQLPFVRVIYSARPMVHIFLIISGFVLTYKPVRQIHQQQFGALANTLSSSLFRRAMRLFLPSFVAIFIMALAVFYGISNDRYAAPAFQLSTQIQHAWLTCWKLVGASWAINDLSYPHPVYNPALWTIPVEFAQSLLLFTICLGLARCVTHIRLFLLGGIISFCFYSGMLYTTEFLIGMMVAELTFLQEQSPSASPASSPRLPEYELEDSFKSQSYRDSTKTKLIQVFWIANAFSGLFIASWTNNHVDELWGLRFLDAHTPAPYHGQKVWFCVGAIQIVAACTQLKFLQDIFNTSFAQYLGNISYALYLTHNLTLTVLEPQFVPILDNVFSKATFWGRQLSWAAGLVLMLPFVFYVADVFWRAIDLPTVRFAKWLEERCVVAEKKR